VRVVEPIEPGPALAIDHNVMTAVLALYSDVAFCGRARCRSLALLRYEPSLSFSLYPVSACCCHFLGLASRQVVRSGDELKRLAVHSYFDMVCSEGSGRLALGVLTPWQGVASFDEAGVTNRRKYQ
jgi:hypothetical protein